MKANQINADRGVESWRVRATVDEKAERMALMSHCAYYILVFLHPSCSHRPSVIISEFIHVSIVVKSVVGLMMLLLSLTFVAAEWRTRWRANRAVLTYWPLQWFSVGPFSCAHTHTLINSSSLPLVSINTSVYQQQSTHFSRQLPALWITNAGDEGNTCVFGHGHTQPNTHTHTLYR